MKAIGIIPLLVILLSQSPNRTSEVPNTFTKCGCGCGSDFCSCGMKENCAGVSDLIEDIKNEKDKNKLFLEEIVRLKAELKQIYRSNNASKTPY